ncbi:unnamed protein product, partial [marine sediment metagenome]
SNPIHYTFYYLISSTFYQLQDLTNKFTVQTLGVQSAPANEVILEGTF